MGKFYMEGPSAWGLIEGLQLLPVKASLL